MDKAKAHSGWFVSLGDHVPGGTGSVRLTFFHRAPDLSHARHKTALTSLLRSVCPGRTKKWITERAGQFWCFFAEVRTGDLVAIRTRGGSGIAFGRVKSPCTYVDDVNTGGARYSRRVDWLGEFSSRAFSQALQFDFGQKDIFRISSQDIVKARTLIELQKKRRKRTTPDPDLDPSLFGFDLGDYAYLDDAKPEAWVAEFLSRNKEFLADYYKWSCAGDDAELKRSIRRKYGVNFVSWLTPIPRMPAREDLFLKIRFPRTVRAFRVIPRDDHSAREAVSVTTQSLLTAHIESSEKGDPETAEKHWKAVGSLTTGDHSTDPEVLVGELTGSPDIERPLEDIPDTLFLAIRMNRLRDEINDEVKAVLALNEKRTKARGIPKNAKYYMMVWDLKERYHQSIERISRLLAQESPEFESREGDPLEGATDRIKRYHKKAEDLIDRGYKRLL